MWLTSKTPAARRVARCSSRIPVYWTGISHPPKGTMRAPALRWAACSGVRFSTGSATVPPGTPRASLPPMAPLRCASSGGREPLAQRRHVAAGPLEGLSHRPHDSRRAGGVAVAADRLHGDVDLDAVDRPHLAL